MNNRLLVILLSAFVIAATCSYWVYHVIGTRLSLASPHTTGVLVAATDLKVGSVVRDVDLKTVQMSGGAPKDAITRRQDAVGRAVVSNVYQGEPILTNRLAAPGTGAGLAAAIPPGMRACAVRVDDVVGVAGFVTSGMRVDVLISGNPPGPATQGEGTRVRTLLQNIQVLSAGTELQQESGDARAKQVQVVNLLVTPEQAEDLSLASSQAHIQLVLRNPLDTAVAEPPGTALGALFGGVKPAPAPPMAPRIQDSRPVRVIPKPEPPHTYSVQVYNGSKKSEAQFDSEGNK